MNVNNISNNTSIDTLNEIINGYWKDGKEFIVSRVEDGKLYYPKIEKVYCVNEFANMKIMTEKSNSGSVYKVYEIPQYNKSKFKIPHDNATYKEVLEASEMTDEDFKGFLKVGGRCSGFTHMTGFDAVDKKCTGVACRMCPIDEGNSKETIEVWMNGEDIWKPKMRDMTHEELLYFLWEKNKSECVVARYSFGEYRPYSTHGSSGTSLLEYTFATTDKTGKITEFEIPQVEE